jgi:hypothetical protein
MYWIVKGMNQRLCDIPNLRLGEFGLNNFFKLNVFFPELMEKVQKGNKEEWKSGIDRLKLQKFYELVVLPALRLAGLSSQALNRLPLNYFMARMQSTGKQGYSCKSHMLESEYIEELIVCMRLIISINPDLAEFRDFFCHIHSKAHKGVVYLHILIARI